MADNLKGKMAIQLARHLNLLGIKYERNGEIFSVQTDDGDVFGTFLVVPKDFRVSFFSALSFEVMADKLEEMLLAVNSINASAGLNGVRMYIDVNKTSNAVFCDQYLYCAGGNVPEHGVKNIISMFRNINAYYGDLLEKLNSGKFTLAEVIKQIR